MANFYGATGLIGGSSGDLDNIDGTNLASGDGAIVITSTAAYIYYLNASSAAAESSPDVISPDANAGNKRWILVDIIGEDAVMELLKLYDTDKSHQLSVKWNEDDSGNRALNILVGGADRTLTLNENLTVGDGENGTITFSAASKTLTVDDSVTIGAHKNRHDPEDGADPLDTAAAAEIAGVQAAGTGTSHSLARADHAHQIQHGITDNHLVTVDGSPSDDEYARWTANGLEGRSAAQVRTDINVADGADVTGSNAPQAHAASHKTSGSDEIDGDQLDIDFTPTNYTPDTTPAEASSADHLSAHLAGIDNALGQWYGLAWNESTDAYTRRGSLVGVSAGSKPADALVPIQAAMRRCVMSDAGVVVYYLDPTDSTKKEGGGTANLDGTDGQVMVQIPAFYYKYAYASNTHYWDISPVPRDGFSLHPAFQKNGEMVEYRYIGAYEGSMYDASAGAMVGDADIETNMYASGDKLCSISGEYPKTNETRAEFRAMAAARGTGWRQMDIYLLSAVQLLYLVEYADFDSQSMISNGRTMFSSGAWEAANQGNGKYIGACGYSNGDGNASGGSSRASALDISAIDTSGASYQDYMTYRGIENLFGNVWKWVDGINVNDNVPYFCNDDSDFADDTATNYYAPGVTLHNADGWPTTLEQIPDGFLAAAIGGSDSTYLCDYYYQNTGWRVVAFGSHAYSTLNAGAFSVYASYASSGGSVAIGGRLCF